MSVEHDTCTVISTHPNLSHLLLLVVMMFIAFAWECSKFDSKDIIAFSGLVIFANEVIQTLESTQLALGTLYLEDHQCVIFVLYHEAVLTLSTMISCSSSLLPQQLPTIDKNGEQVDMILPSTSSESTTHKWCRSSCYLEAALELESVMESIFSLRTRRQLLIAMALFLPNLNDSLEYNEPSCCALYSLDCKEKIINFALIDKIIAGFENVDVQDYNILMKLLATIISNSLQMSPLPAKCTNTKSSSRSSSVDKEMYLCEEIISTLCSFEVNGILLNACKKAVLFCSSGNMRVPVFVDAFQYCVSNERIKHVVMNEDLRAMNDILTSLEYLALARMSPSISYSPYSFPHENNCTPQPYIDLPLRKWATRLLQQQIHRCLTSPLVLRRSDSNHQNGHMSAPFPYHSSAIQNNHNVLLMPSRNLTEVVQVIIDLLPRLLTSLEVGLNMDMGEVNVSGKQVGGLFVDRGIGFLTTLLSIKAKV